MSASEALCTATISALSVSATVCAAPSFDFTITVLPSTCSIVPATRCPCGCCAHADETAKAATRATPAKIPSLLICFLRVKCFQQLGLGDLVSRLGLKELAPKTRPQRLGPKDSAPKT